MTAPPCLHCGQPESDHYDGFCEHWARHVQGGPPMRRYTSRAMYFERVKAAEYPYAQMTAEVGPLSFHGAPFTMEPASSTAIPARRDLDTVTGAEWRNATLAERQEFIEAQRRKGCVAFGCLQCSFPVAYGGAPCDSCDYKGPVDSDPDLEDET